MQNKIIELIRGWIICFVLFASSIVYAQPGASLSRITTSTSGVSNSSLRLTRTTATIEKRSLRRMGTVGNRGVASIGATMVLSSPELLWQKVDRFALGAKLDSPSTLLIGPKELHGKATGWVSEKSVLKYGGNFESYWRNSQTVRGKFFESQSVIQANASLKKAGSLDRFVVTAVEGDPGHAADLVRLRNGEIVERFQLKSTNNIETLYKAVGDTKYEGMTIVGHSEAIEALRDDIKIKKMEMQRRGKPLPSKWADAEKALDNGWLTDELVAGKKVDGLEVTSKNAKKYINWQWRKVASGKSTATARGAATLSKAGTRLGSITAKSAKLLQSSLKTLEFVAFPVDFAFAGYGYYDSINKYNSGGLDQDLFVTKTTIHTTEAGLGAIGAYLAGVSVGLFAVPEPAVSKALGVIVLVGSGIVIAADYAVDGIAGRRNRQLTELINGLSAQERYEMLRGEIAERLKLVTASN